MKNILLIPLSFLFISTGTFVQIPVSKKPQVLIFLSAKCPCIYSHQQTFGSLITKYKNKIDFTAVFVDKNDDNEDIADMLKNLRWKINYVRDTKGEYVKKYHPKVYTDCVLASSSGNVLYKGAVDDSPLNMGQVLNFYLQEAIENYFTDQPVKVKEGKGIGCLILISTK